MKKSKQSLELDDIDLDVDGDEDIDLNGNSGEDEDIIELTDEILDELVDEDLPSDHFDFDVELLDEDDDQKGNAEPAALASERANFLDDDLMDDDLLTDDLLKDLSFDDDRSDAGGVATLGVFEEPMKKDQSDDLDEDLLFNLGELPDNRPVEEVAFLDAEDPDMGMGATAVPLTAAALPEELPDEMESALDEIIDQLENRMTSFIQQAIEARLPDLVRSILKEEIERLKQEIQ